MPSESLYENRTLPSRESLHSGEMHDTSLANRCLLEDAPVQRSGYDFRCRFMVAGCVSAVASVEIQQTISRVLSHVSLIEFASSTLPMLAIETVGAMLLHEYTYEVEGSHTC